MNRERRQHRHEQRFWAAKEGFMGLKDSWWLTLDSTGSQQQLWWMLEGEEGEQRAAHALGCGTFGVILHIACGG